MLQTAIIPLLILLVLAWQSKRRDVISERSNPLDKTTTHVLKGICALVVVMVHFPADKINPLQDAIGSFAYIAVTFFFFVSAYGMQYSLERRPDYLRRFWVNRLAALLVPMFIVNLIYFIYNCIDPEYGHKTLWTLVSFNQYVIVLLTYYVAFYVLNKIAVHIKWLTRGRIDLILILLIGTSSLTAYLTKDCEYTLLGWPYERYGLVWGLLAYRYRDKVLAWLSTRNIAKILIYTIVSGILGVAYLKFKTCYFTGEYLLKIILGLTLIILLFLMSARWKFDNPMGRFLGDISYEIYLVHGTVMLYINCLVPELSSGWFVLLTYIAVIPVSYLIKQASKPIVDFLK